MRGAVLIGLASAVVVGFGVVAVGSSDDDYEVNAVLASATNLVEGGTVKVDGSPAGTIKDISVRDGKANLTLDLEDDFAPVHDGAKVIVEWKATIGERHVNVIDGPTENAEIPNGGMLRGKMQAPMEVDQVLNKLDKPTRERLVSLLDRLNGTLKGNEGDINETVRSAGPALEALGAVLRGLGTDGPAIKQLITQLDSIVSTLAKRESSVRAVIDQLSRTTKLTAQRKAELSQVLAKLPGTLDTADRTLGNVPAVVDEVSPLLRDAKPATERLPSVARNLRPVLRDLRPMTAELRPTLAATSELLNYTPGLLDRVHATVPGVDTLVSDLTPALAFLRPFTPEVAGWVGNWASANAPYDSHGHYMRIFAQVGSTADVVNPGIPAPPGFTKDPTPMPGSLVNQPWTDAFGSEMR